MSAIETGGIDCDIHPSVPSLKALYPYLTDHWRDIIVQRGMHELNSIAYPANSPLTARNMVTPSAYMSVASFPASPANISGAI